jgi:hypothetical protein
MCNQHSLVSKGVRQGTPWNLGDGGENAAKQLLPCLEFANRMLHSLCQHADLLRCQNGKIAKERSWQRMHVDTGNAGIMLTPASSPQLPDTDDNCHIIVSPSHT